MRKVLAIVLAIACMFTFSFSMAFAAEPTNHALGSPGPAPVVDAVQKVVNEINALPAADKITVKDKADVEQARADYNALTDKEKQDTRLTPTVMKKLTDCEAALAKAEADQVSALLRALDPSTASREDVAAARKAYDALSDAAKAQVDPNAYLNLQKAEYNWNKTDAQARKVVMKSAKVKKGKKVVATWSAELTGQNGYQLTYSTSKKFKKKATKSTYVKDAATMSKTVKKLKKGKKYYFKVRCYTEVYNPTKAGNEKVYGPWSNVKKTKKVKK